MQVPLWAECGGKGSVATADAASASACCPVNSQCLRVNEFYWQCQPYQDPVVYYSGCTGKTEVRAPSDVVHKELIRRGVCV